MISLVCGYKKTGKDALCKMFNKLEPFKWIVYRRPGSDTVFTIKPVTRIGFADALQKEVNKMLDISESDIIDYRSFKETIIKDNKTYRDLLIEHAAFRRNQNIDYWVENTIDWENISDNIMITDWRYPNELEYLQRIQRVPNIITIRLFRSSIPIPPDNIISEHQLDNIMTNFVLVSDTETIETKK